MHDIISTEELRAAIRAEVVELGLQEQLDALGDIDPGLQTQIDALTTADVGLQDQIDTLGAVLVIDGGTPSTVFAE